MEKKLKQFFEEKKEKDLPKIVIWDYKIEEELVEWLHEKNEKKVKKYMGKILIECGIDPYEICVLQSYVDTQCTFYCLLKNRFEYISIKLKENDTFTIYDSKGAYNYSFKKKGLDQIELKLLMYEIQTDQKRFSHLNTKDDYYVKLQNEELIVSIQIEYENTPVEQLDQQLIQCPMPQNSLEVLNQIAHVIKVPLTKIPKIQIKLERKGKKALETIQTIQLRYGTPQHVMEKNEETMWKMTGANQFEYQNNNFHIFKNNQGKLDIHIHNISEEELDEIDLKQLWNQTCQEIKQLEENIESKLTRKKD